MAKKNREASSAAVVHMPEELVKSILSFVPVESLLRFKSVSKSWYFIICNDPNFVRLHLNHAQINPKNDASFVTKIADFNKTVNKFTHLHLNNNNDDDSNCNYDNAIDLDLPFRRRDYPQLPLNPTMTIHASCDGILCVSVYGFDDDEEYTFLWNPATKHSLLLPESGIPDYRIDEAFEYSMSSLGFGFEPIGCDYKLVRVLDFNCDGIYGEVYSTKECVWREVKFVEAFLVYGSFAVCVKGVLYWVLGHEVGVLTFDLRNEVFGVHRFSEDVIKAFGDGYNLTVLEYDDSVVLFSCSRGEEDRSSYVISMWTFCDVRLDANGNGSVVLGSWTRKFMFKVDRTVRFVYGYLKTGYFLMQGDGVLFLYNLDKKETHNLSHLRYAHEIFRYTASLVSFAGSEKAQWKPTYSNSKEEEQATDDVTLEAAQMLLSLGDLLEQ